MTQASQSHKAAVLMAMRLIRPVFESHGYDLNGYSNNAVADALLQTCPQMNGSWLSAKHLQMTVRQLKKAGRAGIFGFARLQLFGFMRRQRRS